MESAGRKVQEKNVPQIAVVITNGQSDDNVQPYAKKLKNQGFTLYAIGVKNADQKELKLIASEPHDQHASLTSVLSGHLSKDCPGAVHRCREKRTPFYSVSELHRFQNLTSTDRLEKHKTCYCGKSQKQRLNNTTHTGNTTENKLLLHKDKTV